MTGDILPCPASAIESGCEPEALRTAGVILSHIRFLLANAGPPLTRREVAILDLVDLAQDVPDAVVEQRDVRDGLDQWQRVTVCRAAARSRLARRDCLCESGNSWELGLGSSGFGRMFGAVVALLAILIVVVQAADRIRAVDHRNYIPMAHEAPFIGASQAREADAGGNDDRAGKASDDIDRSDR